MEATLDEPVPIASPSMRNQSLSRSRDLGISSSLPGSIAAWFSIISVILDAMIGGSETFEPTKFAHSASFFAVSSNPG